MLGPLFLLGILCPLLAGADEDPAPSRCLKMMTFNIRYGTAPDGDDSWTMRKDLLRKVIQDSAPDILGLQEALRFQIDELREAFPEYGEIGVGREDGKEAGEYSPILYRTSRLSVDSMGTFWFSDTPSIPGSKTWGNRYSRICTWAVFRDRDSGDSLAVFNVHWDHESQRSRELSADLLLRRIEQTAPGMPVAAMGDFNAGEENSAVVSLKASLRDSFREIHPHDSLAGTFHAFRGTRSGEKIDHIFVNPLLTVSAASIVRFHKDGRYPSDHFPVTATICFRKQR